MVAGCAPSPLSQVREGVWESGKWHGAVDALVVHGKGTHLKQAFQKHISKCQPSQERFSHDVNT